MGACASRQSEPVARGGHDARGCAHRRLHGRGKLGTASRTSGRTMRHLVGTHLLEYGTTAGIARRQLLEVRVDMPLHLTLGFADEAETDRIAGRGRSRADGERPCIPERAEHTRSRTEFPQALVTPGQVVSFFASGPQQHVANLWSPCEDRLAVIQGLGGDFAGVVDAHEAGRLAPFRCRKRDLVRARDAGGPGDGPRRRRGRKHGPEGAVHADEQVVDGAIGTHGTYYYGRWRYNLRLCCGFFTPAAGTAVGGQPGYRQQAGFAKAGHLQYTLAPFSGLVAPPLRFGWRAADGDF